MPILQSLVQPLTGGGSGTVLSAQGGTIVQNAGVLNINVNSLQPQPTVQIAGQPGINLASGTGSNQVSLQGTIVQTSQGQKLVIQGQPTVGIGQPLNLLVPNMGIPQVILRQQTPVMQHITQPVSIQAAVNVPTIGVSSNIGQVSLGVRLPLSNTNSVSSSVTQAVVAPMVSTSVVNIQGAPVATSQPINMVNVGGTPIVIQHAPGSIQGQNVILQAVPSSHVQGHPGQVTIRSAAVAPVSAPGQVTIRRASAAANMKNLAAAASLNIKTAKSEATNSIPPISDNILSNSEISKIHSSQGMLQTSSSNSLSYEQQIRALNSQIQMLKGLPASQKLAQSTPNLVTATSSSFFAQSQESKKSTIHYLPKPTNPVLSEALPSSSSEENTAAIESRLSSASPLPVLDILQSACLNAAIPGSDFFAESELNVGESIQQTISTNDVQKPICISQIQSNIGIPSNSISPSVGGNVTHLSSTKRNANSSPGKRHVRSKSGTNSNKSVEGLTGDANNVLCVDLTGSDDLNESSSSKTSNSMNSVKNVQTVQTSSQPSTGNRNMAISTTSINTLASSTSTTEMPSVLQQFCQTTTNASNTQSVTNISRPPPNVEISSTGLFQGSHLAKVNESETATMAIQEVQISSTESIISELFPDSLPTRDIFDDLKNVNTAKSESISDILISSTSKVDPFGPNIMAHSPKVKPEVAQNTPSPSMKENSSKVNVQKLINNQAKLILGNRTTQTAVVPTTLGISSTSPVLRSSLPANNSVSGSVILTSCTQSQPVANISHHPKTENCLPDPISHSQIITKLPVVTTSVTFTQPGQIIVPSVVSTSNIVGTSASATLPGARNISSTNTLGGALLTNVNGSLNVIPTSNRVQVNSGNTVMSGLLLPNSQPIQLSLEHQQLLYKIQQQLRKLMAIQDRNPQQEKVMQGLMNARQKIIQQGKVAAIMQQEQRKQLQVRILINFTNNMLGTLFVKEERQIDLYFTSQ